MLLAAPQRVLDRSVGAPGSGRLVVTGRGPKSAVTRCYAASPLKLLTPINHGRAAWVYTSTYGGGLVDGDTMSLDVEVEPHAWAFLSTQSSTKVYPSPEAGTRSELVARVGDDAGLIVVPDATVCFSNAWFTQALKIDVAASGSAVVVDWMTSGRRAYGERWRFASYDSTMTVRVGGRLTIHDRLRLAAEDGALGERLGKLNAIATVAIVGPAVSEHAASLVRELQAAPVERHADPFTTASAVRGGGAIVRIAGTTPELVGRKLRELLGFVPDLIGDDPWARKW